MEKFTPSIIYWDKGLKGQSQVNSFPGTELRMNFKKTYSWTILSDVIIPEQHDQISESNYWTVCLIVHISESSNWTVCLKELVFKSNYWTACSESDKRISESNYWTTCSLFRSTYYWIKLLKQRVFRCTYFWIQFLNNGSAKSYCLHHYWTSIIFKGLNT